MMWKYKKKGKESMGRLPLFCNEAVLSSDQTSQEAAGKESLPRYTCRLYKLTKYFTMECLCRQSFATLQLTPLLPTFPSIDTADIPVLAQMRCMLPAQKYILYRVLLILLKETYFLYDWSPVTASAPLTG